MQYVPTIRSKFLTYSKVQYAVEEFTQPIIHLLPTLRLKSKFAGRRIAFPDDLIFRRVCASTQHTTIMRRVRNYTCYLL